MATFKAVIRYKKKDGLCPVFIRIVHNSRMAYIKTDKVVAAQMVDRDGVICDRFVMSYCASLILDYSERLNHVVCKSWTVGDVKRFLEGNQKSVLFSDYARQYIDDMVDRGQVNNAMVYRAALKSLEGFVGSERISFQQLTGRVVVEWLKVLGGTKRAKSLYPICIRQVWRNAVEMLGMGMDSPLYGVVNPWRGVDFERSEKTLRGPLSAEECRRFFSWGIKGKRRGCSRQELGRDVAMLVLCLAGINTVDLFNMRREDYYNGVLHYSRSKTKGRRRDNAYFEVEVHPMLFPIFEKYASDEGSEYLFNFADRYGSAKLFNCTVNAGIKRICEDMGIAERDYYSAYSFRRTWATTAQNDCGATISEVGFGLNHSGALSVTRGYIALDFSPAWELNRKVIDFIFFTNKPSRLSMDMDASRDKKQDDVFSVGADDVVFARVYYQGGLIGAVTDSGFDDVDAVIRRAMSELEVDVASGSVVQVRVQNCRTKCELFRECRK